MTPQAAWDALRTELREIAILRSTSSLLGWDEQTHLPPAGGEWRAEQLGYFSRMIHERMTSNKLLDLLADVEAHPDAKVPETDIAANARELRRIVDRATRIPVDLVEEMARHEVLSQQAWVEARKQSDFKAFLPWLTKTYDLKRREADCVGFKDHPYDALIDDYEPHETAAGARTVLEGLRDGLIALVKKVVASGKVAPKLPGPFPVAGQEAFCIAAAKAVGFNFDAGRLDISVHPFCSGMAPDDTRITTRYSEDEFTQSFFGVLHETGHGLYEQGLPKKQMFGLPLAEAVSLGIHESQSRMWENLVGRSRSFWKHFLPIARQHLPTLKNVKDDDLIWAVNSVEPSLIRVEADEVTYNLHILLRFELESAMVGQHLDPKDLPAAWNAKIKTYLGIDVPDDAHGCMQDIHWAGGLVGYFPTYTLGNLYASQFFEQAGQDIGDLDEMFASGQFKPLLAWLRENIHRHGRRYSARELCKRITTKDLSPEPLVRHLTKKVEEFYG